eukprot:scaffold2277_cov128-Skeletonema_marinoi.AAC.8
MMKAACQIRHHDVDIQPRTTRDPILQRNSIYGFARVSKKELFILKSGNDINNDRHNSQQSTYNQINLLFKSNQ